MKRIQAMVTPHAIERVLQGLRAAGLFVTGKIRPYGRNNRKITFYVKDDEALAAILLVKRAAYQDGCRDGNITIHSVEPPGAARNLKLN
jgi:hypothetical protein